MTPLRCSFGDMARVARNSLGGQCGDLRLGRVIYCEKLAESAVGKAWVVRRPELCPRCGTFIFGYLDADLDPIRPPNPGTTEKIDISEGIAHG